MVFVTCRFATQTSGLHNVELQSRHRRVAEMTCQSYLNAAFFLLRVPTFISKRYKKGKAVPALGYTGVEVQLYSLLTTAQDAVLIFNKQPLLSKRSLSTRMPFKTPEPPGNVRRFDEPQHLSGCGGDRTTPVYNYLLLIYSVLHVLLAFFKTRRFPTKEHLYL